MQRVLVAIPSNAPGGLDAEMSAHFGHCDVYTLVTVQDGNAAEVRTLPNTGHAEGGCLVPVQMLADAGVNYLLAGGMGMRPLMAFRQAGIEVLFAGGQITVGGSLNSFLAGKLPGFGEDAVCHGGGHCHH